MPHPVTSFAIASLSLMTGLVAMAAGAGPEVEDRIRALQGYEWTMPVPASPASEAEVRALLAIARDVSQPNYIRGRAAASLTRYPTNDVWDYFADEALAAPMSVRRRRAVDGLCETFRSDAGRVQVFLEGLAGDPDVQVQNRVMACLATLTQGMENP